MKLKPGDPVYWPLDPKLTGKVRKTPAGLVVEGDYPGYMPCVIFRGVRGWKRRKVERGGGIE